MKGLILAFAALLTAAALTAGLASAAPAKNDVQVTGNVRIDANDSTVAYVTARYVCVGGAGAHVWVSVKQAESRLPESWLTEEGSGGLAAAWSHSHRNVVTCDGEWHAATFTVDQVEWGQGELAQGQGWVQFCVIPPTGEEDIVWSMRFAAVK
jgi:hypothetical protein